jgi:hypothetical protein
MNLARFLVLSSAAVTVHYASSSLAASGADRAFSGAGLALVEAARVQSPATSPAPPLDFQAYKTRVEPIFLKPRDNGIRCVSCHGSIASRLRLQPLAPGSTSWTEEESRRNFEAVLRLVAAGEPLKSRLLLHPLSAEAGGDPTHTGGKFWKSQDDPEWQTVASWVRAGSAVDRAPARATVLDFETFKSRVQPILLKKRDGRARCIVCHGSRGEGGGAGSLRLAALSAGSASWNEEESRRNFEAVQRVVVPGDPLSSRLLMKPLAHAAGGERVHGGGKHWDSQDDPEWTMLAAWVRGAP